MERLLCGTVEYVFVDSVTVEWMVTVTTEINTPISIISQSWTACISQCFAKQWILPRRQNNLYSQPPVTHSYPGIQQPPPRASEQVVSLPGHAPTTLEHVCPLGQHPTSPDPVSSTCSHVSAVPQHRSDRPIEVHARVPVGHLKSLEPRRFQRFASNGSEG